MDDEAKDWLSKGDSDLKVVEHELKLPEDEIVKDAVCFHCQQAVEKYLKAFLICHKVQYKKTHNIEFLMEECGKIDAAFKGVDVKNLTYFGVMIRYPEETYIPDMSEVQFYFELAQKIKQLVLLKIDGEASVKQPDETNET